MIKEANKVQKKFNCGVYAPANDFLQGIVDGNFDYNDYFYNASEILKRSDAMLVVEGYENSKGTQKEIEYCNRCNIPVFYSIYELQKWLDRPIIITICGKSGSGKTEVAKFIEETFDIPILNSYTDRPKRTPNEIGHNFISEFEFNKIKFEDMVAYTKFGDYRYCATKNQIKENNVYVIDEKGLAHLQSNFKSEYKILSLFIDRKEIDVEQERKDRDEMNFFLSKYFYDFVIPNDSELVVLHDVTETIMKSVLKEFGRC